MNQAYTKVVLEDGSVVLVQTSEALFGRDGCQLFSSREVTLATHEQRKNMREMVRDYNNNL